MAIFFRILSYFFKGIRILLRTIWMLYQVCLGAALILIIYYGFKGLNYIHWFEIRDLPEKRPALTSFMQGEKKRIEADSALLATVKENREKKAKKDLIWWEWIPLDSIPKIVRDLAIIAEDGKFYEHGGFDLEQIEYALVANHQQGKRARGASTISQQVVKNLYLSGDKTYTRKIREAVMTTLLEERLEKEKILELYLNIAQFGPGVFGVKAGAEYHFHKPLGDLDLEETVSLVALLPSPLKWNPHKQTNVYSRHRLRIIRNYGLYKRLEQKIPDDLLELFVKYAEEEESLRWAKLRSGPLVDDDSTATAADSTGEKKSILGKLKFWGPKKQDSQGSGESGSESENSQE